MRNEPGGHLGPAVWGWQATRRRAGSIMESMVIDMNEAQLRTLRLVSVVNQFDGPPIKLGDGR